MPAVNVPDGSNEHKPAGATADGPQLPSGAGLLTSAALPSTATVVTIVTGAATGADFLTHQMFAIAGFTPAVIFFSAIISLLATFAAALPLIWKMALWPLNFCVLLYLVVSSSVFVDKVKEANQPPTVPALSHVVTQQILPGSGDAH